MYLISTIFAEITWKLCFALVLGDLCCYTNMYSPDDIHYVLEMIRVQYIEIHIKGKLFTIVEIRYRLQ
jgi:hypothetical protein